MKLRLLILLAGLLVGGKSFALPPCPTSGVKNNCYGSSTFANGDKYFGEFRDGKRHGQGTYTFASGNKYVGEFRDGKYHGQGTYYSLADDEFKGDKYVGEYRNNKRHGQGTYTHSSGDKYVGEYRNNKRHGQGTYYSLADDEFKGDKYVGEFRDNDRNGQGIYTSVDGRKTVGEWRDHMPYESIQYFADSQVKGTYSNGQWCGGCTPTARQLALAQEAQSVARAITLNRELLGTGTGFVVARNYLVTAEHVVEECNSVTVLMRHDEVESDVISVDKKNDLALLRIRTNAESVAKLRRSDIRLGEVAVNFGFPLVGVLSPNPQITAGYVSSLAGIENNYASLQYSAPTQFGNSGGPVLDASGNVIGVVSGKLNDAKTQNVNFATKATILADFLRANKVPFEKADLTEELKLPDIAEKAEGFTVLVGCWE